MPDYYPCGTCGTVRLCNNDAKECMKCRTKRLRQEHYVRYTNRLKLINIVLNTPASEISDNKTKVSVTNSECGHTFVAQLLNVLNGRSRCGVCGPKKRMAHALTFFKAKYTPDDPTDFARFKRKVRNLTEQTYKANIDTINPLRHKRSRPDVNPDAWQLDHKVSIFEAYKQGWTPEATSALENLQMLPALENFQKQRF